MSEQSASASVLSSTTTTYGVAAVLATIIPKTVSQTSVRPEAAAKAGQPCGKDAQSGDFRLTSAAGWGCSTLKEAPRALLMALIPCC